MVAGAADHYLALLTGVGAHHQRLVGVLDGAGVVDQGQRQTQAVVPGTANVAHGVAGAEEGRVEPLGSQAALQRAALSATAGAVDVPCVVDVRLTLLLVAPEASCAHLLVASH